jgi:hypothetical protein
VPVSQQRAKQKGLTFGGHTASAQKSRTLCILLYMTESSYETSYCIRTSIVHVPHSKSGLVPRSSFSGAGQLGFRGAGKGGTMGEGRGKWGQFIVNLRRRRTVPVTAGGCQVSERGAMGS